MTIWKELPGEERSPLSRHSPLPKGSCPDSPLFSAGVRRPTSEERSAERRKPHDCGRSSAPVSIAEEVAPAINHRERSRVEGAGRRPPRQAEGRRGRGSAPGAGSHFAQPPEKRVLRSLSICHGVCEARTGAGLRLRAAWPQSSARSPREGPPLSVRYWISRADPRLRAASRQKLLPAVPAISWRPRRRRSSRSSGRQPISAISAATLTPRRGVRVA